MSPENYSPLHLASFLAARSSQWPALEKMHLKKEPFCRFCGGVLHLQVHHVTPVHVAPDRELDPNNLITLCMAPGRECHFVHGHLGGWWRWNRHITAEARMTGPVSFLAAVGDDWAFAIHVDGDDLVMPTGRFTCFGGSDDPQDDGSTASGYSTRLHPEVAAVALPMDGRAFATSNKAFHAALDGSPLGRVPFLTSVAVTIGLQTEIFPVIDLGPARRTRNALDLTIAAARRFAPRATATNFVQRGSYRVIHGKGLLMS